MKILISIICVCTLFQVQAQVFPESDAIWNIQIDGKKHYYGLSGDTIISDIVYNKLYLLNDTTLNIGKNDEYIGGFRQEGKKVWFRPSFPLFYPLYDDLPYPEETLLYDFSKNVGDTIWHNSIPGLFYWNLRDSISASIIMSIDIDELGREIYHTCQFVSHLNDNDLYFSGRCDSWIEGIGSVEHGLFWFLSSITWGGEPVFHLNCFKQEEDIKYINKDYCTSCFYCSSDVSILEKNNVPLEVVHKNNSIRIIGKSSVFPCELKLFSPIGQLISEKILQSDKEEMPVNQKGVLLYQVQKKNGEVIKKGKIMIK